MAAPGIITGSSSRLNIFRRVGSSTRPRSNQGVFGPNPGATPKYAFNARTGGRGRDAEYRESMARLFVEVPQHKMERFLSTVAAETRPLARVLASGTQTGGGGGTGFIDFLMTRADEQFNEKAQIVDTLTDNYVAFYSGQSPTAFQYSGMLLNTYQDDQRVWMLRLYREILRGTRLANRGMVARLRYDSLLLSGYLENLALGLDGATDHNSSTFSFTFRVKRMSVFTPALGAPTIVETPANSGSVIDGANEGEEDNVRVGTVTPETPPTATEGPGADATAATLADLELRRSQLQAIGMPTDAVDALLLQSQEAVQLPEEDFREVEERARQEGLDRIDQQAALSRIVGGSSFLAEALNPEANPENASEDGANGLSNVRGDTSQLRQVRESEDFDIRRRTANRRRGVAAVSPLGAAALSALDVL